MKISKQAWLTTVIAAGALTIGVLGMSGEAQAGYKGSVYVAGMGGHFAKADVEIDPAKSQPIQLNGLSKVDIGDKDSHPVHDARIDSTNKNNMFWSTYKIDKKTSKVHVGKTDLTTGKVTLDVGVDVPEKATNTGAMYCASAQNKDKFIPISMTSLGYIDVFNKSDLQRTQRIFLEGTDGDIGKPYKFYHGVNSPDNKRLIIAANEADQPHGKTIGKLHLIAMDLDEFVNGKVKVLNKVVLPGAESKTVSFRMTFSPDGKMLAASGADRMWLLDGSTFEVLDTEMMDGLEQNHDAMFTPDGKYVIATSRTKQANPDCADPKNPKEGEFVMDGTLKLYDVAAKKWVGDSTSVCGACHKKEGIKEHAVLCGLDANLDTI